MAKYIASFDQTVFSDRSAVETELAKYSGTIDKEYAFALTFKVDITKANLAQVNGVVYSELASKKLNTSAVFDIDHLVDIVNEPGGQLAWAPINTGAGQVVYLIDTGVDLAHTELSAAEHFYTRFADGVDSDGHGTAVASLIVGDNIGVSPGATLKSVRLFDAVSGNITVGDIIDGLDAVLLDHLSTSSKVKVVCMPWTIEKNSLVDSKISELLENNLLAVAAGGNDGGEVDDISPGGLNPILTVGSYDEDYVVSSFNNLPFCEAPVPSVAANEADMAIDVFALGEGVNVAAAGTTNGFATAAGTSAAAGIVAGAALQWITAFSTYSASRIRSVLANEGVQKGNQFLDYDNVVAPSNTVINYSRITNSVVSIPLADQLARPSGRICDVAYNATANVDIELNSAAANVSVLDFAPLSPWMSFDTATGILSVDPSLSANSNISPGIYNFGVRGEIDGKVLVEEYNVGVFTSNIAELDSAAEYYYDAESDSYEQVVTYQGASADQIKTIF